MLMQKNNELLNCLIHTYERNLQRPVFTSLKINQNFIGIDLKSPEYLTQPFEDLKK